MLAACKDFEDAERERHDFLKGTMIHYCELKKASLFASINHLDEVIQFYKSVNTDKDIESFTRASGTGQDRPMPIQFAPPEQIVYMHQQMTSQRRNTKTK